LSITASNGEDEDRVIRVQRLTSSQPVKTVSQPSSLVRAVIRILVYGTIGLNSTEFPEVIDCMTAIPSASATPSKKRRPLFTKRGKFICHLLDRIHVESPRNFYDIGKNSEPYDKIAPNEIIFVEM